MNEQALEDFFMEKISTDDFLNGIFSKAYHKEGVFVVTSGHLLKLCSLTIDKRIDTGLLEVISDNVIMSDYFEWDNETKDGEIVSQTLFEWRNPTINFEINELNLKLWREYLQTGEHKFTSFNVWSSHIQAQKNICEKYNVDWRPVNPKHKVGISDNLDKEPIHGLRHPFEKGTTGWFIWTGEYSTHENFFKPYHAGHLLQMRPDLIKYLGLPPGYRFLIDSNGYEDVWKDKQLLTI